VKRFVTLSISTTGPPLALVAPSRPVD